MNSELQGTLRRLKPEKHRIQLRPRRESELKFITTVSNTPRKLLYDTTVYIDILQNRFPQSGDVMLRAAEAWHSPVTEAELSAAIGLLDPARPENERSSSKSELFWSEDPGIEPFSLTPQYGEKLGYCQACLPGFRDTGKTNGARP